MRWRVFGWFSVCWLLCASPLFAGTGGILKVLPEFLDKNGKTALTPSLYDRDAYQAILRIHPSRRSGIRFYIQWKTKGAVWEPLVVRLELRGAAAGTLPKKLVLDNFVENVATPFSRWVEVDLVGDEYKNFGGVTAWRASLWEGRRMLGKQQSFLW